MFPILPLIGGFLGNLGTVLTGGKPATVSGTSQPPAAPPNYLPWVIGGGLAIFALFGLVIATRPSR